VHTSLFEKMTFKKALKRFRWYPGYQKRDLWDFLLQLPICIVDILYVDGLSTTLYMFYGHRYIIYSDRVIIIFECYYSNRHFHDKMMRILTILGMRLFHPIKLEANELQIFEMCSWKVYVEWWRKEIIRRSNRTKAISLLLRCGDFVM
jgi:hypothetical protein